MDLSVLLHRGYPAAAGQVLRTGLGKGKLSGVRLRPAAPACPVSGWLRRTVCASGSAPDPVAQKKRRANLCCPPVAEIAAEVRSPETERRRQ